MAKQGRGHGSRSPSGVQGVPLALTGISAPILMELASRGIKTVGDWDAIKPADRPRAYVKLVERGVERMAATWKQTHERRSGS